jgi:cytochrome c-type biogenesis protein CcmE
MRRDVCSELASHDACVLLLIVLLTGGLINVLVFVALRSDIAYHYSVASSHQQRFGSDES